MQCRIKDLRCKEVINITDGCRLGTVADVDIRIPEGQVCAIIVLDPAAFSGCLAGGRSFISPGTASPVSAMTSF